MDSPEPLPEFATGSVFFPIFVYVTIVVMMSLVVSSLHPPTRRLLRISLKQIWLVLRQMVGWLFIIIGLLGMILPGPGIPFFILGVLLVGRRHHVLRRSWVFIRLTLRHWRRRPGLIGRAALLAHWQLQFVRRQLRPIFRSHNTQQQEQREDVP